MYYFKKISLINKKLRLVRRKSRLEIKYKKLGFEDLHKRDIIYTRIECLENEIEDIEKSLAYLQNEKPTQKNKINNTSLNVGAKNESGAKITLPPFHND